MLQNWTCGIPIEKNHRDLNQANTMASELLCVKRPPDSESSLKNPLDFILLHTLRKQKILQHFAISIKIHRNCDSVIFKIVRSKEAFERHSTQTVTFRL